MHVVLSIRHHGHTKMVGKVLGLDSPNGRYDIFLHEDGRGNQHHVNLNAPGGIDRLVIQFLLANDIGVVHHYVKPSKELWMADTAAILQHGIEQQSDGRDRLYLPYPYWQKSPVGRWYQVPWIGATKVLGQPIMEAV